MKLFCKIFGHKWEYDFEEDFVSRKCKTCGLKQKPLITENILINGLEWIINV